MKKAENSKKKNTEKKIIFQSENQDSEIFDVIIIGGGAAGMSAALWCDELGLKSLLLEKNIEPGGQLLYVFNPIKNHLGADAKNGLELQKIFLKQIEQRKFTLYAQAAVVEINAEKRFVILESGENIKWRFLIIATGVRRRKLGAQGEEKFTRKGIIESGKRDAKLVKNKKTAIVGGGDAALENALILAETASAVTVIHRRKEFRARAEFLAEVRKNPKIKILTETTVTKFIGDEKLESLELKNSQTKEIFTLPVEAVLLRIGVEANTEIFRGKVDLDERGYVRVNNKCETSAKNIFAVGDAANPVSPTVSSAVGMGATAAKVIYGKLSS